MRKRIIGVGAVILVALGVLLGFKGLGTGNHDGESDDSDGETVQVSVAHEASPLVPPVPADEDDTPATETPDILTLLVEDDRYLIQWGEDWHAEFSPSTLEEVVRRAREAPGDENGVRVRLRFRENAQNGAIEDLTTALTEAGVEPEAIIKDSGYVE